MYKCSAIQEQVAKQQEVFSNLLNPSRCTFFLRNDIKNCGCGHLLSTEQLMYKTVPARKQIFKQQTEILTQATLVPKPLLANPTCQPGAIKLNTIKRENSL